MFMSCYYDTCRLLGCMSWALGLTRYDVLLLNPPIWSTLAMFHIHYGINVGISVDVGMIYEGYLYVVE